MHLLIYSDGGARGNPGPAGIGVLIKNEDGKILAEIAQYLGRASNNQAEYKAIIAGVKKAKELGATEITCYLDSLLIVKQVNREYRVKDKDLAVLFLELNNILISFKNFNFKHIKRELNKEADFLVNKAIDEARL